MSACGPGRLERVLPVVVAAATAARQQRRDDRRRAHADGPAAEPVSCGRTSTFLDPVCARGSRIRAEAARQSERVQGPRRDSTAAASPASQLCDSPASVGRGIRPIRVRGASQTEAIERVGPPLPVGLDLHARLEVDPHAEQRLELAAGRRCPPRLSTEPPRPMTMPFCDSRSTRTTTREREERTVGRLPLLDLLGRSPRSSAGSSSRATASSFSRSSSATRNDSG